jgi:DNA-binding beta-propeller fold protein YncE
MGATTTTTRRGFVAGAGATVGVAVAPTLARAAAPMKARRQLVLRARALAATPRGDLLIVAHDHARTIAIVTRRGGARRIVDVGGQPLHVAVSPDGRTAAVTLASWDKPGLVLVDLATASVVHRADAGPAPFGVVYAGRRIVVSGGEQEGTLQLFDAAGALLQRTRVGLLPRAVAATANLAYVALHGDNAIACVDLRRGRVTRQLSTPALPDALALAPDRRRLLVSHGGRDAERVSLLDLASGHVRVRHAGRQPQAVAFTAGGRAIVAAAGDGDIVVFAAKARRHHVGGAPRGLALAAGRIYTADALGDELRSVRP